jgi:outer membrane assembly lipoprotein YfiO
MTRRRGSVIVACVAGLLLAAPSRAEEYELKQGQWVKVPAPAKGTPAGELALIRKLLDDGEPKDALGAAEDFLEAYPDDPACEEVMVLAGQAEMDRGRYWPAYERFEEQLKRYPGGQFFERVLRREYEVAEAFLAGKKRTVLYVLRLSAKGEAVDILNRIAEHAPRSELAEKALLRVGEHHLAEDDYAEAAAAYDRYLQAFGKSKLAPMAMLKAAEATFASYRGPAFDDTPLVDAEQRYRHFLERFPAEAKQANAAEMLRTIAGLRAEKLIETARFYERVGRPSAAAFYYRRVTDEYARTSWAKEAQSALDGLGEAGGKGPAGEGADGRPPKEAKAAGEPAGAGKEGRSEE